MIRHRTPALVDVASILGVVGSPWVTFPVRMTIAVVLGRGRKWLQLAVFVSAIVTSQILVTTIKWIVDRDRPPGGLVRAAGASFPSGHAAAAAVTALGVVVTFVPRGQRRWHWILAATMLATLMSWSRTYLSVHWASDTVAGSALGVAVALLTEAAFEAWSDRRTPVATPS